MLSEIELVLHYMPRYMISEMSQVQGMQIVLDVSFTNDHIQVVSFLRYQRHRTRNVIRKLSQIGFQRISAESNQSHLQGPTTASIAHHFLPVDVNIAQKATRQHVNNPSYLAQSSQDWHQGTFSKLLLWNTRPMLICRTGICSSNDGMLAPIA